MWCLSDMQVRQLYGVKKDLLGLLDGRETFVIGKDGTVLLKYNNQVCHHPAVHLVAGLDHPRDVATIACSFADCLAD